MFSLEALKWCQGKKRVCLFDCGLQQKSKPEELSHRETAASKLYS